MGSRLAQPFKALDGQSAINTVSPWLAAEQANKIVAWVEWKTGVSAGVVKLQGAPSNTYTGTPVDLGTFTFATADTADIQTIEKTVPFVRLKITTGLVGGVGDGYIDLLN